MARLRSLRHASIGVLLMLVLLAVPNAGAAPVGSEAPSGERIAFTGKQPGDPWSIYMARPNGTGVKQLSENNRSKYSPSWSPSGTHIVYAEWHTCTELMVLRVSDAKTTRLTDNDFCDVSPEWSPNGARIAFATDRKIPGESVPGVSKEPQNDYNIYVMRADGSGKARRLTDNPQWDSCPAWSPDGSQIAFSSHQHHTWDIYLMNADGSNVRRLTHHPEGDWCPKFSPDGSQILFTSQRDRSETYPQNTEVYVMDADGTHEEPLTDDPAEDWADDWSPDGTRIIFGSGRGGGALYLMDNQGLDVEPYLPGEEMEGADWWAPGA